VGFLYDVFIDDRWIGRVVMAPFDGRAVAPEARCLLVTKLVSDEGGCRIYQVVTN
jgi:hypothetical protein